MADHPVVPAEGIEHAIRVLRGHRVLLDADLAHLYGVEAKVLNQAVKRNAARFPSDFMFQLTLEEAQASRSQTVTLKRGANIKYLPYAFTEQGVAMLSSVLRSPRAVQVNIEIMRAFVRLRQMLQENTELARKLATLEKKYDAQFRGARTPSIRGLSDGHRSPQRPLVGSLCWRPRAGRSVVGAGEPSRLRARSGCGGVVRVHA